ncbi:hypothetical protein AURDEDRAFT_172131 [Auricularia subglabra TFB-10046 SS5]|nr:hypothetical protein AURDEDRAFT_172131 [Auricularia subglabra TFB-10046 SS5]
MTERALKYTSSFAVREEQPPVVSAVFSPDAKYLAMCHDSTLGRALDISLWKLEDTGAGIEFTMKLPFAVKSVVWPAEGIGATFLGTSGSMLVLLPSDTGIGGEVRVVIVDFSFDVLALSFLKKFDYHLLATASKTQICRYAVDSAGTTFTYQHHFQHPMGDLEPVTLAWADAPGYGADCLWIAYNDGSVVKCNAENGTAMNIIGAGGRSPITWASFSHSYLAAIDVTQRLTRLDLTTGGGRAMTIARKATFATWAHSGATLVHGAENAAIALSDVHSGESFAQLRDSAKKRVRVVAEIDTVTPWLLCTISPEGKCNVLTIWKALEDEHGRMQVISEYLTDTLFLARAGAVTLLMLSMAWWRMSK